MLMGIYALHLIFFQALMQAAPSYNVDNSFKTLFNPHAQSHATHNVPGAKHPAVTYYSMLVKQGNNLGTSCENVTPAIQQAVATVTPNVLSALFHINQTSIGQLHLADDTFKVYRLIQAFLI